MGDLRGRLIAFDLDGTLVDSRRDLTDSANALIEELGGRPLAQEAIGRMVGEGAAVLVSRALRAAGVDAGGDDGALPRNLARFLQLYDARLLQHTVPYAGTAAILASLRSRAPLAVLTNKPFGATMKVLEGLQLAQYFAGVIGGDGPFPRKPDPTALRHLMAAHEAPAARTVLVGDSRVDFDTARAAGVSICLARYGFGYETFPTERLDGRELLIDCPADLPAALAPLVA